MTRSPGVLLLALLTTASLIAQTSTQAPLEQRIVRADSGKYRTMKAVHDGPGALDYRPLFDAESLESSLFFMHRGVIEPKSGIGAHSTISVKKCSSSSTARPSSPSMDGRLW